MGRRRAAESVPETEDGIEDVIIQHTRTKRGVRTKQKSVPVVIPSKEKPGQSSRSKGKQQRLDLDNVGGSGDVLATMDDPQTHQFIDEQVDDLPELDSEQGPPHANVCISFHMPGSAALIGHSL
jgi:hypothetical protein